MNTVDEHSCRKNYLRFPSIETDSTTRKHEGPTGILYLFGDGYGHSSIAIERNIVQPSVDPYVDWSSAHVVELQGPVCSEINPNGQPFGFSECGEHGGFADLVLLGVFAV